MRSNEFWSCSSFFFIIVDFRVSTLFKKRHGFGRLIPKRRIGFRFELGAQFQGKPKVYAGDIDNVLENKQVTDAVDEETKDDIAKVMDWLKVYPVMKFSIRGRIL